MSSPASTSVIMPVRNGERFVRAAVQSVLAQLADGDELLLINDASTDGTRASLPLDEPRLRLLEGSGAGAAAARNRGLAQARGELLAFLDHDDLWPAGRHAAMRAALAGDTTLDAVAGRVRFAVEADGSIAGYAHLDGQFAPSLLPSCLYRRALVERCGGFDESLAYGEDTDYHQRLLEEGMRLGHCEVDALVYRRHAGNASATPPAHAQLALALVARKLARRRARER